MEIELDSNTDTLEIEDVFFDLSTDTVNQFCVRVTCGTVIFRRCRFSTTTVNTAITTTDNTHTMHICFYNKHCYLCITLCATTPDMITPTRVADSKGRASVKCQSGEGLKPCRK